MANDIEFFENYVAEAAQCLKRMGIFIRWGDDFHVFKRILARNGERYAPAPGFDPAKEQGRGLEGLWLVAYDRDQRLVHTQASRLVSIEPNMKEHLSWGANAYEPAYLQFDLDNLDVNVSDDAMALSGKAVYHGEAWLLGGPKGIRGGPALYIFSRMMIAKALAKWNVDTVFGLITPNTGIKGLAQRYGYMRCEQGAMLFNAESEMPLDIWLVWMHAQEAKGQLRLSADYFVRMHEAMAERPAKVA
ncbi:MAG: hypothetical protein AAF903_12455 [Pseudomonadota bacterium]